MILKASREYFTLMCRKSVNKWTVIEKNCVYSGENFIGSIQKIYNSVSHVKCIIYFFILDFILTCHVEAENELARSSVGTDSAGGLKADEKCLLIGAHSTDSSAAE